MADEIMQGMKQRGYVQGPVAQAFRQTMPEGYPEGYIGQPTTASVGVAEVVNGIEMILERTLACVRELEHRLFGASEPPPLGAGVGTAIGKSSVASMAANAQKLAAVIEGEVNRLVARV